MCMGAGNVRACVFVCVCPYLMVLRLLNRYILGLDFCLYITFFMVLIIKNTTWKIYMTNHSVRLRMKGKGPEAWKGNKKWVLDPEWSTAHIQVAVG